ncbi:hypothetical protein BN946_scf184470.g31 [Trametes cinnabarina]|uniref:Glucose-6-phosphate 1-dehydrogenase n=1 Tax=Pycnoporus cinnabarinus TaxID=5643 RepID=A0A060SUY7_PYCCI|nr:hypothetical protein BN946_scf184470.g31 [Trametes cinnabarina]
MSGTIPSMETSSHDALKDNTVIVGTARCVGRPCEEEGTRRYLISAPIRAHPAQTYPALFGLYRMGFLPRDVRIVGYARTKMDDAEYHKRITSYIKIADDDQHGKAKLEEFKRFTFYISGGYEDGPSFEKLNKFLEDIESKYQSKERNRLFYLALPPSVFIPVAQHLKEQCYSKDGKNRIIVEKPFGKDLESCRELLSSLKQHWSEDETFRIDHYLGKEMVKNILVLRFANIAFGAPWDKNSISNVQITFKEPFGTEGRGGYFDEFGIIRDILQNHLLQVLSVLTMERPVSFSAEDIRDEKVKVLRAIPPIERNDTLLGQYVAANGKPGYLDDDTPSEAVYLKINTKTPGLNTRAIPAEMDLTYKRRFTEIKIPEAYEALILDALRGDHSNFVRDDELDVAWKIFTPILHWIDGKNGPAPKPVPYPYGSRGPKELDSFIQKYGYKRTVAE